MEQKTKFKQTEIGKIPEDWQVETLKKSTLEIFSGGTPNTMKEEYWNGAIPWLSSGETSQTFIRNTERKITKLGVENSSTRLAKRHDVVVAGAGQGHTRGQPSFCLIDTYVNQSVVVLRANKEKLLPLFLFYNLLSRYNELRQLSDAHSSRGSLTTKLLAGLPIKLPKIEDQKIIEKILSDLDFKIELNQRMNKTIEAIGQALFKRWFVDFEFPDENGKPYKSSGGEMIESELGMIPKRWKIGKLNDLVDNIKFPLQAGEEISKRKYVPIDNLPMHQIGLTSYLPYSDAQSSLIGFEKDDILIGAMRVYFHRVNLAPFSGVTRATCFVLRPKDKNLLSYSLFLLNQDETISFANSHSKGSTMPYAVWNESFENMPVLVPNDNILKEFNNQLYPLLCRIRDTIFESRNLSQIRDSLLPKLMSGEIRVPTENDKLH